MKVVQPDQKFFDVADAFSRTTKAGENCSREERHVDVMTKGAEFSNLTKLSEGDLNFLARINFDTR